MERRTRTPYGRLGGGVARWPISLLGLAILFLPGRLAAQLSLQSSPGRTPKMDLRASILHGYTDDNLTNRHNNYSDFRISLDTEDKVAVHGDILVRRSWNERMEHRLQASRLNLEWTSVERRWSVAAGRLLVRSVDDGQVDGAHASFALNSATRVSIFGGLRPHPIDQRLSAKFLTGGAGYEHRSGHLNLAGGLQLQLYEGSIDRLLFSNRWFVNLGRGAQFFGHATVDFFGASGILGALQDMAPNAQSDAERFDLPSAQLGVSLRPIASVRIRATANHTHTLLSRLWWQDWIAEERARLGFQLDGPEPVGTRRSTLRLQATWRPSRHIAPYAEVRSDFRHNDAQRGETVRGGLKLTPNANGYFDISMHWRNYFGTRQWMGQASAAYELHQILQAEASASALRLFPESHDPMMLYDASAGLYLSPVSLENALGSLQLGCHYQGFIDDTMVLHAGFVRVLYRFRTAPRPN